MITILVAPARRRFGRPPRRQWKFAIMAANGMISDRANPGDILAVLHELVGGDQSVTAVVRDGDGNVTRSTLRPAART